MRKITFLLALLCVSVMGWAIDWSGVDWLGNGTANPAYTEKYKALAGDPGPSSIGNIQSPGWASAPGLYVTFPSADFRSVSLDESQYDKEGAGMLFHVDAFIGQETVVEVNVGGTIRSFTVYYEDGDPKLDPSFVRTSEKAIELDISETSTITYTTSSTGAVTFVSSNDAIASVDGSGVITANASGEVLITAEQAADVTYRRALFTVKVSVNYPKQASTHGYGSLRLENVDLYNLVGNDAGSNACGKVDVYVVTFGDKLLYKAVLKESKTFENCTNYFSQLRTRKPDLSNMREHWALTCSPDLTMRYMDMNQSSNAPGLSEYGDNIKLSSYMVVTGCGPRTIKTVNYTRDYINNINTSDVTAPVLGAATITPSESDITISFSEVTSEEVFYMIEDAEHGKKYLSMIPSFVLPKDGSGITYNYSCYAIDFNGNISAAQSAEVEMPFSALTNLALNKPCSAGYEDGNSGEAATKANDGNEGSLWVTYADRPAAEEWWCVDLSELYNISNIQVAWGGDYSTEYILQVREDAPSESDKADDSKWTTIATVSDATANSTKSTDVSAVGRYVRFRSISRSSNCIRMKEFRVYASSVYDPSAVVDTEAPVINSATLSSKTHNTAVIELDAEDNVGIIKVKAVDSSKGIDVDMIPDGNNITLTELAELTSYTLTLTAYDATNNVSDPLVMAAFTTDPDPARPQVAAPTPDGTGKEVRPIYSDAFPSILAHPFDKDGFEGAHGVSKTISGDEFMIYDVSSTHYVTMGMYDDGANAIIAADGYHSASYKGVDASTMEYLHVDIWSLQACSSIDVFINDQELTTLRLSHNGEGWQSFNIALTEFDVASDVTRRNDNVRWLKFTAFNSVTGNIAIDNIYFYKNESNIKTISLSVNNGSWGSATAKVGENVVTEVANGTEVTFTATPNSGYDFVNWTIGGSEVSTAVEYTTAITANTTIIANFEAHRTPYCATPVSDTGGRTLFLTISKTENANEYKILFEGSEENRITNTNVYVGTVLRLRNVNGVAEYHFSNAEGIWHVSSDGFGSAYVTFTASDFRDISFVDKGVDLYRNMSYGTSGDLSSFNAFPDASLIKWDATCTDEEAPILAAPTATPLSGTSVRLAVSATDDMAALLTYNVNYKPEGDAGAGTDLEFNGTAGEVTYKNIKGLSAGVRYQFSVTVSDGTNTSAAQVCYAKPTMPTAPVPAHNANLVRSIYSDKYESALAHDFIKNNWNWIPYTQQSIGGDNFLVYTSNPEEQAQMPNVAWGDNNDGANAIIAKDGFNDGTNKGLDVREMQYIHFDMWSAVATIYPQIALNDDVLGFFRLNGTGWQSFDLPLSTLTEDKLNNIRWIAFGGFRDPNPEEIAIDNVYFWSYGTQTTPIMGGDAATGGWATFSSPVKVAVPSGLTAYKATYSNEGGDEQLVLDAVSGAIPANEGVLLRGEANHVYTFSPTNDAAGDYTGNALVGCPVRTDISSVAATNDIFCLRYSDIFQITGFYLYSGQYIAAGKAYLPLAKAEPSSAPRRIRFVFREEQGTTGFDPTNAEAVPTTKFIENGQIYIQRGEAVYTIQGVRVK